MDKLIPAILITVNGGLITDVTLRGVKAKVVIVDYDNYGREEDNDGLVEEYPVTESDVAFHVNIDRETEAEEVVYKKLKEWEEAQ